MEKCPFLILEIGHSIECGYLTYSDSCPCKIDILLSVGKNTSARGAKRSTNTSEVPDYNCHRTSRGENQPSAERKSLPSVGTLPKSTHNL
uniref:Ovule protein n=1 Tax=Steinernema glaseri TaxID=37863 RepID=A0A1I7ZIM6_9BILA